VRHGEEPGQRVETLPIHSNPPIVRQHLIVVTLPVGMNSVNVHTLQLVLLGTFVRLGDCDTVLWPLSPRLLPGGILIQEFDNHDA
jgi:hypothetical protein